MPPFTSWYLGTENIGWLIGTAVPGRRPRHADARDPGQRPAGVRPLHAHHGRRLRAVPPAGARDRRTARSRTSARSSSRRCSRRSGCPPGCPPTTGPATRSRTPRSRAATTSLGHEAFRTPVTAGARRRRRAARPLARLHAGHARRRPSRQPATAPTPCAGWTLGHLLAHMEDALDAFTEAAAGRVEVRRRCRRRPPGSTRCARRRARCSAPGPRPGRPRTQVDGRRPRPRRPAAGGHRRPRDHRARLGRRPGDRPPDPDPRRPRRGSAGRSPQQVIDPGDRGPRFASPRPAPAEAPSDERLLAWTGRVPAHMTGPLRAIAANRTARRGRAS